MLTERENTLRAIRFQEPEWIPCAVALSPGIWNRHREKLEDIVAGFPSIFGEYESGHRDFDEFPETHRAGEEWTDPWGCVWQNLMNGICGQPKVHPLEDWSAIAKYCPPPPLGEPEVAKMVERVAKARQEGKMVWGGAGRFYERLMFLRGYRNLMMDLVRDPPELRMLIDMIIGHCIPEIRQWVKLGVDGMRWGDDLGAQDRPMMSPERFRRYLLPGYSTMCNIAREAGAETYMHSDGRILELMDCLTEAGFTVLNPQVTVNEIEKLSKIYKGKVCLDADVDRQHILPRGRPRQVRAHIEKIVERLGSREGGLMIIAGVYPDVPLENIKELCQAMEDNMYYRA